jgi:hypothetical protein
MILLFLFIPTSNHITNWPHITQPYQQTYEVSGTETFILKEITGRHEEDKTDIHAKYNILDTMKWRQLNHM